MNRFILIGFISLITSVLFIGVFEDDEFSELGIFTKHRPTTKLFFYSPIGMSDLTLQDLSKKNQLEELAFNEFIIKTGVQFPGKKYDFLPFLLIQLTLTFLSLGFFRIKFKNKFEKWLIPLHFIVNFIITSFILVGMLIFTDTYATIGLGLILLAINYFSIYKLKNQKIFNSSSYWKDGIIDIIDENDKM